MKIRVVGQVAADSGVITENLVFHYVLPRHHGAEEVGDMVRGLVIPLWQSVALNLAERRGRGRMSRTPLVLTLFFLCRRHSTPTIGFKARSHILGRKRQRVPRHHQRSL